MSDYPRPSAAADFSWRAYNDAIRACIRRFLPALGGHGDVDCYLTELELTALEHGRQTQADEFAAERANTLAVRARNPHPERGERQCRSRSRLSRRLLRERQQRSSWRRPGRRWGRGRP